MTSATDTTPVRATSTDGEAELEAYHQPVTGNAVLFITDIADGHYIEAVLTPADAQRLGEALLRWSKP